MIRPSTLDWSTVSVFLDLVLAKLLDVLGIGGSGQRGRLACLDQRSRMGRGVRDDHEAVGEGVAHLRFSLAGRGTPVLRLLGDGLVQCGLGGALIREGDGDPYLGLLVCVQVRKDADPHPVAQPRRDISLVRQPHTQGPGIRVPGEEGAEDGLLDRGLLGADLALDPGELRAQPVCRKLLPGRRVQIQLGEGDSRGRQHVLRLGPATTHHVDQPPTVRTRTEVAAAEAPIHFLERLADLAWRICAAQSSGSFAGALSCWIDI